MGGAYGVINFKLENRYGGVNLSLNTEFVQLTSYGSNITCSGLISGEKYVITAQKVSSSVVMVKIEGKDLGLPVPTLSTLNAEEMSQAGAGILIKEDSYQILQNEFIPFEQSGDVYVATKTVTIPAGAEIQWYDADTYALWGCVVVGDGETLVKVAKQFGAGGAYIDTPVALSLEHTSNFRVFDLVASETEPVSFTITITADENGSTICATLTE